jgi:transcriptional regulator with XRE-family HTH domain
MSRYEQRHKTRMQNTVLASGFREMDAELTLLRALDQVRESLNISKEELAQRMDRTRPSVSRLFSDPESNPTLDTITDVLDALEVTADVTLRPRTSPEENPIRVTAG